METLILFVFVAGYLAITLEHPLKINKSAIAVLTGVICWTLFALDGNYKAEFVEGELAEQFGEIAQILIFLIGAMTIVEIIDSHRGFEVITTRIATTHKVKLLWMISIITFFLSSVLDNLTTAIVMVSLLAKLVENKQDRLFMAGMVIIAANAGGAWTPIGDITTTMLWIKDQISTVSIMTNVFLASAISLIVPLIFLSFTMKGKIQIPEARADGDGIVSGFERNLIFFMGIGGLMFVPVFKVLFHLPPYMGMMMSLGIVWVVTELLHKKKETASKSKLMASSALKRIDVTSVLFFLGILLAVASLQSTGLLEKAAIWLGENIGNQDIIITLIGLLSAIIDNVPLVKAVQGMYDISEYPMDDKLWQYLAYCAGTGGSILIIGSAAGVTVMGMENINFFWYMKRISLIALFGYLAGCAAYLVQYEMMN